MPITQPTKFNPNLSTVANNSLPSSQGLTLVGNKATNPQAGVNKPSNVLPPEFSDPGLIGSPKSLSSSDIQRQAATGYLNYGLGNDPEYNRIRTETANLQSRQPGAIANIQASNYGGIPQSAMSARENIANTQYSNQLSAKQAELSNYLAGKGIQLGALGSAATIANPRQQGYALLNPFTNQPVGGGEGGTGGSGIQGIANWGTNIDYGTQRVRDANDYAGAIGAARQEGSNLSNLLASEPNYNSNQVNFLNTLWQDLQTNTSNPAYPVISSSVKNILSYYADVLGEDYSSLLLQGAQAPSLMNFISGLDAMAQGKLNIARQQSQNPSGYTPSASPFTSSLPANQPSNQPSNNQGLNQTSQSILNKYGIK